MVNAGRVAIVPQGEWSADATYKRLDAVTHNNTLYFAKKEVPAGTETTNTEYWSKSIVGGVGAIATTEAAGIVKPDGTTITIDEDGTIHGQSEITVDGTTITIDEAKGIISLAKTLQDKIKTIDNKLPKTSVVNTNTTTEAGFALDARQANPTIEGTMANQILQLNNDFQNAVPWIQDCNIVNSHFAYATIDTLHTPAAEGKTTSTVSLILTVITPLIPENTSINTQYSFTAVTGEIFARTINVGKISEWKSIFS